MDHVAYLKEKLPGFRRQDIVLTDHARIRALQRQMDLEEIKDNILNPERLEFARKDEANDPEEEKFDCYFVYSRTQCHRYVLAISRKVVVVTAVKINRRWQRYAESKLK